jgi:hypothetical protein
MKSLRDTLWLIGGFIVVGFLLHSWIESGKERSIKEFAGFCEFLAEVVEDREAYEEAVHTKECRGYAEGYFNSLSDHSYEGL